MKQMEEICMRSSLGRRASTCQRFWRQKYKVERRAQSISPPAHKYELSPISQKYQLMTHTFVAQQMIFGNGEKVEYMTVHLSWSNQLVGLGG